MDAQEVVKGKGILEQIKHNTVEYDPTKLTLEDVKKIFADMFNAPKVDRVMELPIYYALGLPDDEFVQFMSIKSGIRLIGGMDAYTKLQERIKQLNIKQ